MILAIHYHEHDLQTSELTILKVVFIAPQVVK